MNEKPTVSFSFMSDTYVPEGFIQAFYNGVNFIFKNYFTKTTPIFYKKIKKIPSINENKTELIEFNTLFSHLLQKSHFKCTDFQIIFTKHRAENDNILGTNTILNVGDTSAHFIISFHLTKYMEFPNPYMVMQNITRHELLHSHILFHFNNFFINNHCSNKDCLMYPRKNYYKLLTKPYDLCDNCKKEIKRFSIPKETLKNNIRNPIKTISGELSEQEVINIVNLYDKICPLR